MEEPLSFRVSGRVIGGPNSDALKLLLYAFMGYIVLRMAGDLACRCSITAFWAAMVLVRSAIFLVSSCSRLRSFDSWDS